MTCALINTLTVISRNNYLLIYRILNSSLLQLNKLVIIMVFIAAYDIVIILLPATVTAAYDIIVKINIIVIDRIAEA